MENFENLNLISVRKQEKEKSNNILSLKTINDTFNLRKKVGNLTKKRVKYEKGRTNLSLNPFLLNKDIIPEKMLEFFRLTIENFRKNEYMALEFLGNDCLDKMKFGAFLFRKFCQNLIELKTKENMSKSSEFESKIYIDHLLEVNIIRYIKKAFQTAEKFKDICAYYELIFLLINLSNFSTKNNSYDYLSEFSDNDFLNIFADILKQDNSQIKHDLYDFLFNCCYENINFAKSLIKSPLSKIIFDNYKELAKSNNAFKVYKDIQDTEFDACRNLICVLAKGVSEFNLSQKRGYLTILTYLVKNSYKENLMWAMNGIKFLIQYDSVINYEPIFRSNFNILENIFNEFFNDNNININNNNNITQVNSNNIFDDTLNKDTNSNNNNMEVVYTNTWKLSLLEYADMPNDFVIKQKSHRLVPNNPLECTIENTSNSNGKKEIVNLIEENEYNVIFYLIDKIRDLNYSINNYNRCYQLLGEIIYMLFNDLGENSIVNLLEKTNIINDIVYFIENSYEQENKRFLIFPLECLINKSIEIAYLLSTKNSILPAIKDILINSGNFLLAKLGTNLIASFVRYKDSDVGYNIFENIRKEHIIFSLIDNIMNKIRDIGLIDEILQIVSICINVGFNIFQKTGNDIFFKELSESNIITILENVKNCYPNKENIMNKIEYIEKMVSDYINKE